MCREEQALACLVVEITLRVSKNFFPFEQVCRHHRTALLDVAGFVVVQLGNDPPQHSCSSVFGVLRKCYDMMICFGHVAQCRASGSKCTGSVMVRCRGNRRDMFQNQCTQAIEHRSEPCDCKWDCSGTLQSTGTAAMQCAHCLCGARAGVSIKQAHNNQSAGASDS